MNENWRAEELDEGEPDEHLLKGSIGSFATHARLEADLTAALRPLQVPSGFADRVLASAASAQDSTQIYAAPITGRVGARRVPTFPLRRRWFASAAVAAALLAGCLAGDVAYQRRTEQRRAAEATAQFQAAERVTDHALDLARERVERAGIRLND